MAGREESDIRAGRSLVRDLGADVSTARIFDYVHDEPYAVFLDSSLESDTERFSIIAYRPYLVLEETEGEAQRVDFHPERGDDENTVAVRDRATPQGVRAEATPQDVRATVTPQDARDADMPLSALAATTPQDLRATVTRIDSFETALQDELDAIAAANPTGLPFLDGAIGYLSYDYGRKFEQIGSGHPRATEAPDARMAFYDRVFVEDLREGVVYAVAHEVLEDGETALDSMERLARNVQAAAEAGAESVTEAEAETKSRTEPQTVTKPGPSPAPHKCSRLASFSPNFEKDEYKSALQRMIDYIVEGDIYIANMTQRLEVAGEARPYDVYRYMRVHNPAPFSAYLSYPETKVVCASMERFLQVRGGRVETRPIKGTRPRGTTAAEDETMRRELEESSKDHSELLMIVDLERNDLNHVCVPGSVEVTEHFAVEAYATVFHLVSTVVGTLRADAGIADLLRAAFPGGSITGAPKIRAMEIIDELEHGRRGLYTGSIGYIAADGSCDFNIVIRTAVWEDGVYRIGVGGGITCESDLEFEYEETLQKARAVLEAIAAAEDMRACGEVGAGVCGDRCSGSGDAGGGAGDDETGGGGQSSSYAVADCCDTGGSDTGEEAEGGRTGRGSGAGDAVDDGAGCRTEDQL